MKIEKLRGLLNSNLDKVLNILSDVFANDNGSFNDLNDKYINGVIVKDDLRSKLNAFINRHRQTIEPFLSAIAIDEKNNIAKDEEFYKSLCTLDFKHQSDYFNAIAKSDKAVIPFIIRAEPKYGQRWLYNRLIREYENERNIHAPIIIDLGVLEYTTDTLINDWAKNLEINNYQENVSLKIRRTLEKRIETATQFIVLKNAASFIHSDEFDDFYSTLNYLNRELSELNNKCIFLFVEETSKAYSRKKYCTCSKTTDVYEVRVAKDLTFIDLHNNESISKNDLKEWLGKVEDSVLRSLGMPVQQFIDDAITNCDNGHPDQVISFICKTIGVNYKENIHKWLKY